MANVQIREGNVYWVRDLNASTSTTAYPTATTAGIAVPAGAGAVGYLGSRVHVDVEHSIASGTVSLVVALYGLPRIMGDMTTSPTWAHLGTFNSGTSMAASTSIPWNPDASTIRKIETFNFSAANYERLATRQIAPGGTTVSTTTYIGFPQE